MSFLPTVTEAFLRCLTYIYKYQFFKKGELQHRAIQYIIFNNSFMDLLPFCATNVLLLGIKVACEKKLNTLCKTQVSWTVLVLFYGFTGLLHFIEKQ